MGKIGINGKMLGGQPSEKIASSFGEVSFLVLDEESSPSAIARDQRHDVLDAYRNGHTTAEKISKFLWLEIWVVRRRLYELGLGPAPDTKIERRPSSAIEDAVPRIVELLKDGPRLSSEIAAEAGLLVQSCLSILRATEDRFISITIGTGNKTRLQWRLRIEQGTTNATG